MTATATTTGTSLTVAEVAAELACGINTVHRAIDRGDLTAFKYGRIVRVARNDLDAFIRAHQQAPARGRSRASR